MKDSYSFDVDDAGLERLLPAPPRRLHQDVRPPRPAVRDRVGDVGRDGRLGERGVPRPARRRRGHVRAHASPGRLRGQRRGRAGPGARPGAARRRPAGASSTTRPDTPTIATLVDLLNARDDLRRADREWTAADTLKNVVVDAAPPRRHARAAGHRRARRPRRRHEAARGGRRAGRAGAVRRGGLRPLPGARQGLHRARRARRRRAPRASATSSTRGSSPAPAGSPAPTQPGRHVVGLVAGRDFTPDGDDRRRRGASPATPAPTARRCEIARGIEIGHIFQLGRKYAEALGLTVLGPDGKPVTVTMGSYGIGVSRAVAAIAETTYDDLGLCWPREVAPADVHVVIAGKPGGRAVAGRPRRSPPTSRRPACGCCSTTATRCRPASSSRTPS